MSTAADGRPVTLITAVDCHPCDCARQVLASIAGELPLTVSEVPWDSHEGRQLVSRDGVAFPPAVYVDGTLVGCGRISERVLRRRLNETAP